jgi:hypothetical protein
MINRRNLQNQSFTERFISFYKSTKKPLALALLVLLLALGVFQESLPENLRKVSLYGTIFSFGFIVIELLFEIHKETNRKIEKKQFFVNWNDVQDDISSVLYNAIEVEKNVTIKGVAIALRVYWQFIDIAITPYLRDFENTKSKKIKINIDICMLDDAFFTSNKHSGDMFDTKYKPHLMAVTSSILAFKERYKKELTELGWEINLHTYDYMPNIYGLLINDKVLFSGYCYWDGVGLEGAADSFYELNTKNDSLGGGNRISVFLSWYNYIISQKIH